MDATQLQMALMGNVKRGPQQVPQELVAMCHSKLDAIRLCIQLSGMSHEYLSDCMGINKGHWSRIMQGQAHFPTNREQELMELCGNYAPLQYQAQACGFELQAVSKDARIQKLEAELAALRGAA